MTPHDHREFVSGCYRCELGRDEARDAAVDAFVGVKAGRSQGEVFWRAYCEPCGFLSSPVIDKAVAVSALRRHASNCDVAALGDQDATSP